MWVVCVNPILGGYCNHSIYLSNYQIKYIQLCFSDESKYRIVTPNDYNTTMKCSSCENVFRFRQDIN